ncbi:hypothetical protein C3L33_17589, partial [Rhododendron williamsianum]
MHAIDQIHESWSSSMDNLEVFLNWFAFGWSVAAVLLFIVTWFYMPNTFADKVMEIIMKWRKEKEEKKKNKAKKQLAHLRFRKQTTVDRVQNAKIHMLEKHGSIRMSYSYLLKATDNFSDDNVIGIGKCATLYKAAIGNDKNFDPKISSFGGRMIMTSNSGNLRMRICEKSEFRESDDVYAFGILLVEVVTGEKPKDVSNLCEGFDETLISGNLCNAIESSLSGKGFDGDISQFLKVALDCIGLSLNERPTMLEVYKSLRSMGAKKGSAYTSEIPMQIGDGCGTHMAEHYGVDIIE